MNYRKQTLYTLALLGTGLLFSSALVQEASAQSAESKVKTAYLYSLMRGSNWPPEAYPADDTPYKLAILGTDNLGGLFDKVAAKKKINKRKIVLERIADLGEYSDAHMLYLPGAAKETVEEAIKKTDGKPVMVIGEGVGMAANGASISLFIDDAGTIGVEVNPTAATARKLEIDEKMLKIGKKVGG